MAPVIQMPGVFWYIGSLYLSGGITVFSNGSGGFKSRSGWNFHFFSVLTALVWRGREAASRPGGEYNLSKLGANCGKQARELTRAIALEFEPHTKRNFICKSYNGI